jgi:hypothetical protein
MNGMAHTDRVGYLEGFFDCQVCDSCPTNIISMSRVEDMYPITYVQGESIVVHLDDRDVVFKHRDGMYVADFSDWLIDDEERVAQVSKDLCLFTVEERESLYSRKQVRRALEAGEYLRALGYPSLQDAINTVKDGNVRNIPYGVEDVRRSLIYMELKYQLSEERPPRNMQQAQIWRIVKQDCRSLTKSWWRTSCTWRRRTSW